MAQVAAEAAAEAATAQVWQYMSEGRNARVATNRVITDIKSVLPTVDTHSAEIIAELRELHSFVAWLTFDDPPQLLGPRKSNRFIALLLTFVTDDEEALPIDDAAPRGPRTGGVDVDFDVAGLAQRGRDLAKPLHEAAGLLATTGDPPSQNLLGRLDDYAAELELLAADLGVADKPPALLERIGQALDARQPDQTDAELAALVGVRPRADDEEATEFEPFRECAARLLAQRRSGESLDAVQLEAMRSVYRQLAESPLDDKQNLFGDMKSIRRAGLDPFPIVEHDDRWLLPVRDADQAIATPSAGSIETPGDANIGEARPAAPLSVGDRARTSSTPVPTPPDEGELEGEPPPPHQAHSPQTDEQETPVDEPDAGAAVAAEPIPEAASVDDGAERMQSSTSPSRNGVPLSEASSVEETERSDVTDAVRSLLVEQPALAAWARRADSDDGSAPSVSALEAVALSSVATSYAQDTLDGIEQRLAHADPASTSLEEAALRLSAVVRLALAAPQSPALHLLRRPDESLSCAPMVLQACTRLIALAQSGRLRELCEGDVGPRIAQLDARIESLSKEAADGMASWPQDRSGHQPANKTWRALMKRDRELYPIVEAVGSRSKDVVLLEALLEPWAVRKALDRAVNREYARHRGGREELQSGVRGWVMERIERVLRLGRDYVAVRKERDALDRPGTSDLASVSRELREDLEHAAAEVAELSTGTPSAAPGLGVLGFALAELRTALVEGVQPIEPATVDEVLKGPLVRATGLAVDDRGAPEDGQDDAFLQELQAAPDRDWPASVRQRATVGDMHLARLGCRWVEDVEEASRLAAELDRQARAHRSDVRTIAKSVELRAARLLRLGLLDPAEHDERLVIVQRLTADQFEAFDIARRQLQALEVDLDEREQRHADGLRERLEATETDARMGASLRDHLDHGRLDIAEELIGQLEQGTDVRHEAIKRPLLEPFLEILAEAPRGVDDLRRGLDEGRSAGGFHFGDVEPGRREAIKAGLADLDLMTKARNPSNAALGSRLRAVGQLVGLDIVAATVEQDSRKSTTGLRPINVDIIPGFATWSPPRFRSGAGAEREDGARARFRVLFGSRGGTEAEIVKLIQTESTTRDRPVLLVLGEPMGLQQRQRLEFEARRQRASFLLLDAYVLAFLPFALGHAESATPLDVLLACSFGVAWDSPYVPQGPVPAEMFVGREVELNEVRSLQGTNFVFGGRQLGKSALLRRIEQETHNPGDGQVCVFLDIKEYGDRLDVELLWTRIAQELERSGMPKVPQPRGRESVTAAIRDWVNKDGPVVRLLLDETDNLLEAEGQHEFPNILALRVLSEDTSRRFKVVFAGLHSVNRFRRIPNQPLAQFGGSTKIGPLGWKDARRLVREPMDTLGYRFEPDEMVDRVLVETRRHPSLIQFVCQALIEHVTAAAGSRRAAPFGLSASDLDEVFERDDALRERLRERFQLTLDLDRRYKVLALIVALESLDDDEIRVRGLTSLQLEELAIDWWPSGFAELQRDGFDVLLEEMVNLEVLAAAGGKFRLPSVNVIRLLGGREKIESELEEEILTPMDDGTSSPERLRRWIEDDRRSRSSALTYGDERLLLGVGDPTLRVVLGTSADHMQWVIHDLRTASGQAEWGAERIDVIAHDHLDATELSRQYATGPSPSERRLHVGLAQPGSDATGFARTMGSLIMTLRKAELQSRVSVVVIVNERWLADWPRFVEEIDALGADARLVQLKRWETAELRRLLDHLNVPVPDGSVERLLLRTAGLSYAVERFVEAVSKPEVDHYRVLTDEHPFTDDSASKLGAVEAPSIFDVFRAVDAVGGSGERGDLVELLSEIVDEPAAALDSLRLLGLLTESASDSGEEPVLVINRLLRNALGEPTGPVDS